MRSYATLSWSFLLRGIKVTGLAGAELEADANATAVRHLSTHCRAPLRRHYPCPALYAAKRMYKMPKDCSSCALMLLGQQVKFSSVHPGLRGHYDCPDDLTIANNLPRDIKPPGKPFQLRDSAVKSHPADAVV